MKKELVLLGSMVAMAGALSSCCKKTPVYNNTIPPAPRVVNYKDGGTAYAPSQPVRTQPVQQPVKKVGRCTQVQPVFQAPVTQVRPATVVQPIVQPVSYTGQLVVPSPGVIEANINYSNSGVLYNAATGCNNVVIPVYNGGYCYPRYQHCHRSYSYHHHRHHHCR
ncbi:MAG: hypothetical protein IKV03_00820 [Alphaproteobacteria bacterium]|nr:hypothetical protein [Alphaproteobacteria bacterium]